MRRLSVKRAADSSTGVLAAAETRARSALAGWRPKHHRRCDMATDAAPEPPLRFVPAAAGVCPRTLTPGTSTAATPGRGHRCRPPLATSDKVGGQIMHPPARQAGSALDLFALVNRFSMLRCNKKLTNMLIVGEIHPQRRECAKECNHGNPRHPWLFCRHH